MNITIKPLSPELLKDYLLFFDNMEFSENPDWSACYCYSFHFTGTKEQWHREANRAAVGRLINEDKMRGYLAFSNGNPVGWCNVNNKSNYQSLAKHYGLTNDPEDKVCSIVCFVIKPEYRRKGVAQKILEQIINDYAIRDYDYLEAYPGQGDLSDERHYVGPLSLYEKFDFKIVKTLDKHFMVRKLLR